jgi:hypothetical protein
MILLDPHDGDLGMSSWVECQACRDLHRPGWLNQSQPGWFAIRAGERHWIDKELRHHFHLDCGAALVAAGLAQVNPSLKPRMATVRLARKKVAR